MECVILARKQRMPEYITPTLEMLALLNETCNGAHDSADGLSSLTGSMATHGFLFTDDSKGSRKYEGWNPAGMRFYNNVLCLIREQRGR
jgi:hypothetical protein